MKKIIQLLQENLYTYKDPTVGRTSGDRCNSHVSSYLSNNWETVNDKFRKPKKRNRTTHDQLPIPVYQLHITTKWQSYLVTYQTIIPLSYQEECILETK